jgi:hypothetical protein
VTDDGEAMTAEQMQQQDELEEPGDAIRTEASTDDTGIDDGMECLRKAAEEQLRQNAGKIASEVGKKAA